MVVFVADGDFSVIMFVVCRFGMINRVSLDLGSYS